MRLILPFFLAYALLAVGLILAATSSHHIGLHDKRLPGLLYRAGIYPLVIMVLAGVIFYSAGALVGAQIAYAGLGSLLILGLGIPSLIVFAVVLVRDFAKALQPPAQEPKP